MDQNATLLIQSTVTSYLLDINDVIFFLESASSKGRFGYVKSIIKTMTSELYFACVQNLKKNNIYVSKELLEENVVSLVDLHTLKYYEKALVVKISQNN